MATAIDETATSLPSRDAPSASQAAAVARLPDNTGATWVAETNRIDPAVYTSPEHFAEEQRLLFRRLPVPMVPSALLKPGHYVARDGYGVPVIISRDKHGQVHAMINACRHRGSRLVRNEDPAKAPMMVCDYHAWSYDLSGDLKAIPRSDVFGPMDKCKLGLRRLPCAELGGIVYIKLDPNADDDFSHVDTEVQDDFKALGIADMYMFGHRRHEVAGNWKLILDTFLEGYHVIRLHVNSLGSMFEDMTTVVDRLGNFLRQTSGRLGFKAADAQAQMETLHGIRSLCTFVYTLVPNAALIVSPDYVSLLVLQPQAHNKTVVDEYQLTDYDPQGVGIVKKWNKSWTLTGKAFPEDFWAAAECQVGLSSGGVPDVWIGGFEAGMQPFHTLIAELMDEGRALEGASADV